MCKTLEEQIGIAATKAKNVLGQLGPLVWALHCHHVLPMQTAILLSADPDEFLATGVEGSRGGKIRKRAIDDIKALRQGIASDDAPRLFTSTGLWEVINRSIVVYAVAVLEQFLDEAGKPAFVAKGGKGADWRESFGSRCKSLCQVGLSLYCCQHYADSALLALMRHKIVHVGAKVDGGLPQQVADIEKKSGRQLCFHLSGDESSVVWTLCGSQRMHCCWVGKDLSLAIDEVILPLLRRAQAFVDEAEHALLERLGKQA